MEHIERAAVPESRRDTAAGSNRDFEDSDHRGTQGHCPRHSKIWLSEVQDLSAHFPLKE